MKIHIRHHFQGIALVAAMISVAVLTILAAMFAYSMMVEARLAQRGNSENQLLWLGISGVQRACWILANSASYPHHSSDQKWAGGPGDICDTNGPLMGISLDNYQVGEGTVSLKIEDLERKANINIATPQMIQQALTLMGVDANSISVVSDSILDWIDSDDLPRVAGAESDYYQGLAVPYYAKNAPIDDLSELLMIKNVTEEIYLGHSSNPTPSKLRHKLGFGRAPWQTPDYPFGLKDIFTPISNGKINVNTADTNVLQLIPGVDGHMADAIIKQRTGSDGMGNMAYNVGNVTAYNSVSDLSRTGIPLNAQQQQQLTVRSSTFEVHVTAQYDNNTREFVAILFVNSPTDVQVVTFYWK